MALALCTGRARAQDPADVNTDLAPLDTAVASARPYWRGSGPTRAFAAAELELRILSYQPKLQIGYGKPHYNWFGAEGYGRMALSGTRWYAGLRGVIPHLSIRGGLRYESAVDHYFLSPQKTYDREDIVITSYSIHYTKLYDSARPKQPPDPLTPTPRAAPAAVR